MREKRFLFITCMFIFILVSTVVTATNVPYYDTDTAVIDAVAESITPNPVEPGSDFTVKLRVYNSGGEQAESVTVEPVQSDIFFLTGKDDDFDKSFSLCVTCSKDNAFYYTVQSNVSSGEYPIVFRITNGLSVSEKTILVRVIGKPDVIFNANVQDEIVVSGKDLHVRLSITNAGTGIARNVKFKPSTTGIVMNDENLIFLDELKPGQIVTKDIVFMVEDTLVPGPKKIAFDISYMDEKGSISQSSQSLGFNLQNIVSIDISSMKLEPTQFTPGLEGTLTLRVENLGEGSAKDVRVKLMTGDFSGNKEAFLGKIEEDEDAPAIFHLTSISQGNKQVPIRITYQDDSGEHSMDETITIEVRSVNHNVLVGLIIGGLVIAVLVFFMIKNKKKDDDD